MKVSLVSYQYEEEDGVDGKASVEREGQETLEDFAETFLTYLHASGFGYVKGVAIDKGDKYPLVWSPA